MRQEDFEVLPHTKNRTPPQVHVEDVGQSERTLLYGYTVDRHSWHVYFKGGLIHLLVTDHADRVVGHGFAPDWDAHRLIPNKRVYPHATDYEFARLLLSRGVDIPFTTFAEERSDWTGFYKLTHDEL